MTDQSIPVSVARSPRALGEPPALVLVLAARGTGWGTKPSSPRPDPRRVRP
jgi:hypothetical protein